jgi:putative transposase
VGIIDLWNVVGDRSMALYRNKYRIESARCPNWDYTSNGVYFVTICTKHHHCFFGNVVGQEMQLSRMGAIVAEEWQKIAQIRPNVRLDTWVVMPNHLHGIIILTNPQQSSPVETSRWDVSTTHRGDDFTATQRPRLQSNSLGAIVGQFKSICTKRIWADGFIEFRWQMRYHDHIIRDEESAVRIQTYILNNPAKWASDKHHPNHASSSRPSVDG